MPKGKIIDKGEIRCIDSEKAIAVINEALEDIAVQQSIETQWRHWRLVTCKQNVIDMNNVEP